MSGLAVTRVRGRLRGGLKYHQTLLKWCNPFRVICEGLQTCFHKVRTIFGHYEQFSECAKSLHASFHSELRYMIRYGVGKMVRRVVSMIWVMRRVDMDSANV
jgi:hypothetical protein